MNAASVKKLLNYSADEKRAKVMQRFFKTGKGEYGEGDLFIGVPVPEQRKIAKQNYSISLDEISNLVYSEIHEERLTAFLILVYKYERADEKSRKDIYDFIIHNRKQLNNWDLVDLTAPKTIGEFLLERDKSLLFKFARSKNIWERRIAVLSTFPFIRENEFHVTLKISEMLLKDDHDLIHKAVGWMLREIGKRNQNAAEAFLKKHNKLMPRTMLRYAIEKLPEGKRKKYLAGKI